MATLTENFKKSEIEELLSEIPTVRQSLKRFEDEIIKHANKPIENFKKSKIEELLSEIPTVQQSLKRFEDEIIKRANKPIENYNRYREPFIVFMLAKIKDAVSKLKNVSSIQELQLQGIVDVDFYEIVMEICNKNCKIIGCELLFNELCEMIKPIGYKINVIYDSNFQNVRKISIMII